MPFHLYFVFIVRPSWREWRYRLSWILTAVGNTHSIRFSKRPHYSSSHHIITQSNIHIYLCVQTRNHNETREEEDDDDGLGWTMTMTTTMMIIWRWKIIYLHENWLRLFFYSMSAREKKSFNIPIDNNGAMKKWRKEVRKEDVYSRKTGSLILNYYFTKQQEKQTCNYDIRIRIWSVFGCIFDFLCFYPAALIFYKSKLTGMKLNAIEIRKLPFSLQTTFIRIHIFFK